MKTSTAPGLKSYSLAQAAERWGVPVDQVADRVREGSLRAYVLLSGEMGLRQRTIDAAIRDREKRQAAAAAKARKERARKAKRAAPRAKVRGTESYGAGTLPNPPGPWRPPQDPVAAMINRLPTEALAGLFELPTRWATYVLRNGSDNELVEVLVDGERARVRLRDTGPPVRVLRVRADIEADRQVSVKAQKVAGGQASGRTRRAAGKAVATEKERRDAIKENVLAGMPLDDAIERAREALAPTTPTKAFVDSCGGKKQFKKYSGLNTRKSGSNSVRRGISG